VRGRIPEEVLAEIRDRASIVEIVSGHVSLRKVGRNHLGLCPFHAEKTPSFTVSDDRGMFHCFGCGAGGNVFTFISKMENLPFPDVVARLAERYGVRLPERGEDDPARRERDDLFALNEKTARFFQRHLWENAEAEPARRYLEERGIGQAVAERYLLGWAPAAGEVLVRRVQAAGRSLEHAIRLGLVSARTGKAGHYDRFRGRLMFPITSSNGRVVGFGSRTVPGTVGDRPDAPKYLNSPETPLYRKGSQLYGLDLARNAIRDAGKALVVEGYFDVLALVEAGIEHAVASCGTALTVDQLRVLKRFTQEIVVFFDGDAAGQKAAEKSLPVFLEAGLWGHGAFLPAGDDPDTFVRREGADAARALLDQARTLFDFYLDRAIGPRTSVPERAKVAAQVAQLVRKIDDPFAYDITVRRAAERLGIAEDLLRRPQPGAAPAAGGPRPVPRPAPAPAPAGAPGAEELLVTLMLREPQIALQVEAEGGFELFEGEVWRALAERIVERVRDDQRVDAAIVLSELDEDLVARVTGRLLDDTFTGPDVDLERMARDCLEALRRHACRRERDEVMRRIRDDDARGDDALVARHLREHTELRQGKRT
jgi:DNA primase